MHLEIPEEFDHLFFVQLSRQDVLIHHKFQECRSIQLHQTCQYLISIQIIESIQNHEEYFINQRKNT
jgi:hypothetical protein